MEKEIVQWKQHIQLEIHRWLQVLLRQEHHEQGARQALHLQVRFQRTDAGLPADCGTSGALQCRGDADDAAGGGFATGPATAAALLADTQCRQQTSPPAPGSVDTDVAGVVGDVSTGQDAVVSVISLPKPPCISLCGAIPDWMENPVRRKLPIQSRSRKNCRFHEVAPRFDALN